MDQPLETNTKGKTSQPHSLYEELYKVESKLNIHHHKGIHLNLESLDNEDFKVNEFFSHNFMLQNSPQL